MRYALAYPDPVSMPFVRIIASSGSDEWVGVLAEEPYRGELASLGIPVAGSVEHLLDIRSLDAVIVGGGASTEVREGLVRTVFQAEIPQIVIHPAGDMLFGFELQMAQVTAKVPILPFVPAIFHPLVQEVASAIGDPTHSATGIGRVLLDRRSTARERSEIEAQFCRDALLLRLLVGRIVRVSALRTWGPSPSESRGSSDRPSPGKENGNTDVFQSWSVQMMDEHGRDIQWRLDSASQDHAKLVIQGDRQTWELEMPEDPAQWTGRRATESGGTEALPVRSSFATAPYTTALEMMASAIQSEGGRRVADTYWDHACRSVELSDAVVRSGRRGRAIDLYHEEHSEENTFKGVMAAGGCIALLVALAVIPMVAIGEQLLPDAEPGSRWLRFPWLLLALLLALFLILQLLRFVITRT